MNVSCAQGLAFLPKTECDVREVEVARGMMLSKTTIEPVAFRVPRVRVSLSGAPWCACGDQQLDRGLRNGFFSADVSLCVPLLPLQKEFFQDDVYPDTAVWWDSALTASAWLSGADGQHRSISLRPKDMTLGTHTLKHTHDPRYTHTEET